jgi:hypothetical protein
MDIGFIYTFWNAWRPAERPASDTTPGDAAA